MFNPKYLWKYLSDGRMMHIIRKCLFRYRSLFMAGHLHAKLILSKCFADPTIKNHFQCFSLPNMRYQSKSKLSTNLKHFTNFVRIIYTKVGHTAQASNQFCLRGKKSNCTRFSVIGCIRKSRKIFISGKHWKGGPTPHLPVQQLETYVF